MTFPIFYKDTCIFTYSLPVLPTVTPIYLLFAIHYLTLYPLFVLNFIFNKILWFLLSSYSCSCYISKLPVLAAAPDITPLLFLLCFPYTYNPSIQVVSQLFLLRFLFYYSITTRFLIVSFSLSSFIM